MVYLGGGGRFHPDKHAAVFDPMTEDRPGIQSQTKSAGGSTITGFMGVSLSADPSAGTGAMRLVHGEE